MNVFEFAIKMENDAEKLYAEQAELNKDNNLGVVFGMLAKDEGKHAEILQKKFADLPFELDQDETLTTEKNVFDGTESFKNELTERTDQLDAYRGALEKEKESVALYEELLGKASDDKEKLLFEYLIKQEQRHRNILEDLVVLVSRPIEWVEDAEFGEREKY